VQRWREIAARFCGLAAALFLLAMMLLTVADVTLRAAFNTPIRGVYELVELLLACTFFVALPAAFLRADNIQVNVLDNLAPRSVPALERVAAAIAVVVLAVMAWQGFLAARDSLEFHDVTADLGLSRVYHWTAVLVGITGALAAALLAVVRGNGRR
jgi:TRAP-type C4-dicarboxylate transport system permease small subunit